MDGDPAPESRASLAGQAPRENHDPVRPRGGRMEIAGAAWAHEDPGYRPNVRGGRQVGGAALERARKLGVVPHDHICADHRLWLPYLDRHANPGLARELLEFRDQARSEGPARAHAQGEWGDAGRDVRAGSDEQCSQHEGACPRHHWAFRVKEWFVATQAFVTPSISK